MLPGNAFVGQKTTPIEEEVARALGSAWPAWQALVERLKNELPITGEEWKSSGAKYGWALRLIAKQRNLVYLGPCEGCFQVSMVLGAKGLEAARAAKLPAAVRKVLEEAPKYPEGWAVRLTVRTEKEVPAVAALTRIKWES